MPFPALKNRNYRIYFFGQFVSVIGTWLQIVAQGWLVLELSGSAFLVGLVAAMATVPAMLFSLIGGVIVDRFPKKRVLTVTQTLAMILALSLGTLTLLDLITVPLIAGMAFLLGTVNAIDAPARQAFVSQLVSKDELASAIALNSSVFNAGRVIGPGLAGILIALTGGGGAFIVNGLSYLAILFALSFLNVQEQTINRQLQPFEAIKHGVQYAIDHPVIRVLLLFTGMLSVFAWSYSTMMPVIASTIFKTDATGLGYLYSATGLGSLVATFLVGAFSKRVSVLVFIVGGNVIFSLSLLLFSSVSTMPMALALLFFCGMGLLLQASTINTIIQSLVRQEFRGRVMSLYILMFLGLAPIGNFEIGWLTDAAGIRTAITINATLVLLAGLVLLRYRNKIRESYRHYKNEQPEQILMAP